MPSVFLAQNIEAKSNPSIIRETDNYVVFRAVLQDGDVMNRNRKIYPSDVIEAALNEPLLQEAIQCGTLYGEAGHPFITDLKRQLYIDYSNVCHSIMKIDRKGNKFYGDMMTTDTSQGKFMKGEVDRGKILSFSMRGLHKLKHENDHFKVEKLKIATYDWVPVPSHAVARMVPATESALEGWGVPVSEEEIKTVLASEGIGSIMAVEDLLDGTPSVVSVKNDTVAIKPIGSSNLLAVTSCRKRTLSLLDEMFGG